jgi:hypothetical protein
MMDCLILLIGSLLDKDTVLQKLCVQIKWEVVSLIAWWIQRQSSEQWKIIPCEHGRKMTKTSLHSFTVKVSNFVWFIK